MSKGHTTLTVCPFCKRKVVKKDKAFCDRCHAQGKTIKDLCALIPPNLNRSLDRPEIRKELFKED